MILQALTQHYEDLLELGQISRPGWGMAKVSYGLELSDEGALLGLLPLKTEQKRGKKVVLVPREMQIPMPVKRTSGIAANFLCDSCGYLLGIDSKGGQKRTADCFAACKRLHQEILSQAASPAAKAVIAFFEHWNPASGTAHPALSEALEELYKGANLIFWYRDVPVASDPEVRALWQSHYDAKDTDSLIRCLVTGEKAPPEEIHPAIKGMRGAQMAGAALVSFNAPAFWSYGHEYGANAPVGSYAAFAYTTALNHLINDREHVQHIGDTTLVCWAEGGQSAYQDLGMAALFGETLTSGDVLSALGKLAHGEPVEWDETKLDPETHFFVLGLAPNAARISVRFFWRDSFGALLQNVQAHYERLRIVRPSYERRETLWLWSLLQETVNKNSRDKDAAPQLAGDVLRAIVTNSRYPATLLNGITLRIRADQEITRGRAAALKAYYLRNENKKCPKEVLTVELNEQSAYLPYVLGRLFSILEAVQNDANPGINATIKDKYFNSASSTPAVVFPLLINLAQKHLHKLKIDRQIYYNKQITALLSKVTETYPDRMSLPEQGAFQLGYYHQTQKRFTKKEEKENVSTDSKPL